MDNVTGMPSYLFFVFLFVIIFFRRGSMDNGTSLSLLTFFRSLF